MATDLRFAQPPASSPPVDLRFNEGETFNPATVAVVLPGPVVAVLNGTPNTLEVQFSLNGPAIVVDLSFDISIPDYLTARGGAPWRQSAPTPGEGSGGAPWAPVRPLVAFGEPGWGPGVPVLPESGMPWSPTLPVRRRPLPAPWRDGAGSAARVGVPWRPLFPLRPDPVVAPWREAVPAVLSRAAPWGQTTVLVQIVNQPWRQAIVALRVVEHAWRQGRWHSGNTRTPWRDGAALVSFGGGPFVIVPPPADVCYDPDGDLRFLEFLPASTDLRFYCENHPVYPPATVIVPIRKVYPVLDTFTLKRVVDNVYLPALTASLSLDRASWTWGATFSLPAAELSQVEADVDGVPVELEATINGNVYRFLAERVSRDRQFPTGRISVSCRGIGGALDLLEGNYDNAGGAANASQIMDAILTVNGVGVGWDIDFGLEDWLVSSGAWAYSGTAISALQAVAGAAGGYLQPHPTAKTLRVLPTYPVMPWDWAGVTPDYELPSAVVTRESIEWVEKPRYNRVIVSGQNVGVTCEVTRTGTTGDVIAPQVVDPLIIDVIPGRQRGGAILGDTGRQAMVRLSLPILASTGIIPPGKFVRYVDGADVRLGITRSVSVDVKRAGSRQTIGIETHA